MIYVRSHYLSIMSGICFPVLLDVCYLLLISLSPYQYITMSVNINKMARTPCFLNVLFEFELRTCMF